MPEVFSMKAKTRFLKMYYKMPKEARNELVMRYPRHPMTLNVVAIEVMNDTKLSKELLKELGYEDDDGSSC